MLLCSVQGCRLSPARVTRKEGGIFCFLILVVVESGPHCVALAGLGSCFCLPRARIKGVHHHAELQKRIGETTQSDLYFTAKKPCAPFHKSIPVMETGPAGLALPEQAGHTPYPSAPQLCCPWPCLGSSVKDPPSPEHPHGHTEVGSNRLLEQERAERSS